MSLVHEALRKAAREKQRKVGAAASAPAASPHPVPPQPIHTPVIHPPAATTPVATVTRETVAHKPAPVAEQPQETNHFLLPALIGCVAIVAIIAIVFLVSNASSALRQSQESTTVAAAAPAAKPAVPAELQPTAQPPTDSATPPNASTPTAPAINESKYKLSGIMKDADGKYVAIVNGRVAYEGYYIDGATLEKIEPDRVTLDVKGQKALLRLR
jgi:hypothetical protein